jgi:cytochrome c oxidase subunit III
MTELPEKAESHESAEEGSHRDYEGTKMGMWLFLFSEIILFGGLFLVYSVYRSLNPDDFHRASLELDTFLGTINTALLITSSLTAALSIVALRKNERSLCLGCIALTVLFGAAFMVNKYFEWSTKIHHGLYPKSLILLSHPRGESLFYGLYFMMTGLHGLHVLVGMTVLSVVFVYVYRGFVSSTYYWKLETSTLYWHLVDIIWIFLYPLFYLVS